MPIKDKSIYPEDWPNIREGILFRASMWVLEEGEEFHYHDGYPRCECEGECGGDHSAEQAGRCEQIHGVANTKTGSRVVLTVAHLDHDASRGVHEDYNLKAFCQGCHLAFDREPNRVRRTGQPRLPLGC